MLVYQHLQRKQHFQPDQLHTNYQWRSGQQMPEWLSR